MEQTYGTRFDSHRVSYGKDGLVYIPLRLYGEMWACFSVSLHSFPIKPSFDIIRCIQDEYETAWQAFVSRPDLWLRAVDVSLRNAAYVDPGLAYEARRYANNSQCFKEGT